MATAYPKAYPVYPGEYIPLPGSEALIEQFETPGAENTPAPGVDMNECKDCYKLELPLPGTKREDIFIHTSGNMLSVTVLHQDPVAGNDSSLHEFDTVSFVRKIVLPENADAGFISASYRSGLLNLHIPKTKGLPMISTVNIVVY